MCTVAVNCWVVPGTCTVTFVGVTETVMLVCAKLSELPASSIATTKHTITSVRYIERRREGMTLLLDRRDHCHEASDLAERKLPQAGGPGL